jgi:signal transduction histidine kinase
MITPDDLRIAPEFADLPEEDLAWLAPQFQEVVVSAGDRPFQPDTPADHLLVVFSGRFQLSVQRGQGWRVADTFKPGAVTGILPYSRMTRFTGRAIALDDCRFGRLHRDRFPDVLYRIPVLGQRLVALLTDRVRTFTRADLGREKLLSLGKLSAGLAHELNNPAAAIQRATADLQTRLDTLPAIVARLAAHGVDPDRLRPATHACSLPTPTTTPSALDLADREDALTDWLDERGVPESWRVAPTLAEGGLDAAGLDAATASVPDEAIPDVVAWIEHSLGTSMLLKELQDASTRISGLVGSVKAYSHMDRSDDLQPVQIRDGIQSTITMLGHKFRAKGIEVTLDVPDDLPTIYGHAGELNQVWTNLMDNAIDAMEGGGRLTVTAAVLGNDVEVHVADTGTGIPPDVVDHIFDPFFTTKDVGQGTGLGLDIVHRIVVKQHRGDITVSTGPSGTTFHVHLPMGAPDTADMPS